MVRPLFCRKRSRDSLGNLSNWILFTSCIFMCYFGMMDISDNCLIYGVLFYFAEQNTWWRLAGEYNHSVFESIVQP